MHFTLNKYLFQLVLRFCHFIIRVGMLQSVISSFLWFFSGIFRPPEDKRQNLKHVNYNMSLLSTSFLDLNILKLFFVENKSMFSHFII